MSEDLNFQLTPVKNKPEKTYTKLSKYDDIINKFLIQNIELAKIYVQKNPDYLRTQLMRRIKSRELQNELKISVINKEIYIEKIS